MKEVVAYCRVACAKESDPSAEAQRQEQMVRRYADARGLIICETYLDADVSGGTLERPALQSLLADCRAGRIDTVITQDLERLSHDPLSLIAVTSKNGLVRCREGSQIGTPSLGRNRCSSRLALS